MNYDLAVIGAGWAGFNAALKAKAGGLKVALIEKGQIGGTCLNRGCIPTKTLLQSAKVYSLIKKSKIFGVETSLPQANFSEIQLRKNKIVAQLQKGMESMLGGIDFINGEAKILSANTLEVNRKQISANFTLISTGSKPLELKSFKFDGKRVISSNEILDLEEIPKSLLIIGGGVIGCEFASLFSALGSQVTIVELTPQLLPGVDKEIARKLETIFKKKSIKVTTNTDAGTIDLSAYSLILVCVGRAPVTEGLGLNEAGIKTQGGRIITDECLKTDIPSIYAAGDCASKICLAHFAAFQGCTAVENILDATHARRTDNTSIPSCIFTDPEIGIIGLTEEEAKAGNVDFAVNKFDFLASGMARVLDETEGFVKIVYDKKTDKTLGASIIGPRATELISILTLAIQSEIKVSDIRNAVLAHPTLSESITGALR